MPAERALFLRTQEPRAKSVALHHPGLLPAQDHAPRDTPHSRRRAKVLSHVAISRHLGLVPFLTERLGQRSRIPLARRRVC